MLHRPKRKMKKALLIGINYKNIEGSELSGCIDDVVSMYEMDFEEKNIILLRDDTENKDLYPSKMNILKMKPLKVVTF